MSFKRFIYDFTTADAGIRYVIYMISLLQMLAKKLGCSTSFTDAQKTVIGVGAAVGVGLAAWAVKTVFDWFSAEDDKDKNKKKYTR